MNPLKLLPLGLQLGIYGAGLAIAAGGVSVALGAFIHHERMIGWNGALAAVAAQDAHAKGIADQAVRDVERCETGGGQFDVSTGNCD